MTPTLTWRKRLRRLEAQIGSFCWDNWRSGAICHSSLLNDWWALVRKAYEKGEISEDEWASRWAIIEPLAWFRGNLKGKVEL